MNPRIRAFASASFLFIQTLSPLPAYAVEFPDVPATHPYHGQIAELGDRGIILGNPDGTFKPSGTVNRAAMLTLLYRAKAKTPTAPSKPCFSDVPAGAWFAAVTCDAAKNGYVGGYSDGTFKPEKDVNRVEALKMIHTVFGFSIDAKASTDPLRAYSDVSLDAWYAPYMSTAFAKKILPISGQTGKTFSPDRALTRGEAAAYIFNALGLTIDAEGEVVQTSSSSSATTRSSSSRTSTDSGPRMIDVDFPFGDDGSFDGKERKVYLFRLQKTVTGSFDVETENETTVQCRLYKIDSATSFSLEYYIGHVSGDRCSMRVSLAPGEYQFEVVPGTSGASYEVTTKTAEGDGNDGFREASMIVKNTPKTGYLEENDHAEWYFFKTTAQAKITVDVSNAEGTSCLIHPMADVDLYGFSGPVCNEEYDFPPGTYYVGVMKRAQRDETQSFTIRLR